MNFSHDRSLLFSRGDPEDLRMGDVVEMVSLKEFDKQRWDWAIIGVPDDRGVELNGGRPGAAHGPHSIRKWFYRLVGRKEQRIADLGDLQMSDDLHADHERATQAIAIALGKAERVAILGGGHDWGYSPIAALMQGGSVGFVNFDAHLDVRANSVHHSGTSYWRALENGVKGEHALWYGIQEAATSAAHLHYVRAHGGHVAFAPSCDPAIVASQTGIVGPDYWDVSLDMDVVSIAEAPGVSAPQAMGLASVALLEAVKRAVGLKGARTFGVYEVAPPLDLPGESTSRLAARFLWEAIRT